MKSREIDAEQTQGKALDDAHEDCAMPASMVKSLFHVGTLHSPIGAISMGNQAIRVAAERNAQKTAS
jgi:hypothetical protein